MTSVWALFTSVATWLKGFSPSKNTLLVIVASVFITWALSDLDRHYAQLKNLMPSWPITRKSAPIAPGIVLQPPPLASAPVLGVTAPVLQAAVSGPPGLEQRVSALEAQIVELQTHFRKPRAMSK
jgi:hypothetical protein